VKLLSAGLGGLELPEANVAREPPEARGLARDGVRLMVSRTSDGSISHGRFYELPSALARGDLLIVNTSATFAAAVPALRPDGEAVLLHLSTPLPGHALPVVPLPSGLWVVELRRKTVHGSRPLLDARAGERLVLPAAGSVELLHAFGETAARESTSFPSGSRLWAAALNLPDDLASYTARHGSPIRYSYVPDAWPLAFSQTVFSHVAGSAEMPSAARPFTRELLARLDRAGVGIARIVLHTGVSSLEAGESPYPERFQVPAATAAAVNAARAAGGRVIAVGTTSVRAIESASGPDGRVRPTQGWTDLVVTVERGVRALDGILTGLHGPDASHLSMLEAFATHEHLERAYRDAIGRGYLWHEFGDSHLIVP
jgi:S-adenosylmethionine:tRNA ribosyltransferase-isomerase